jgi:hypothetical protein
MRNKIGSLIWQNCFRKTHKSKNKIVKALIIVLALIFLSGMASGKRVEAHIIVSNYRFPYLVSESGPALTEQLGVRKTSNRKLTHFYCTNIRAEVANDCSSCSTCRIKGNRIKTSMQLHSNPYKSSKILSVGLLLTGRGHFLRLNTEIYNY